MLSIVNEELNNIYEWFNANKLSLHVDKTNNSPFHRSSKAADYLLFFPKLLINHNEVEMVESIKFLSVLLKDHCQEHVRYNKKSCFKALVYCIDLNHFRHAFFNKTVLLTYSHLLISRKIVMTQYKQKQSKKATESKKTCNLNC